MKKKIQKPFNVEAAKNGAKVETRDGMPVRIICYDKVDGIYPIIALINNDGYETCNGYTPDGKLFCSGPGKHDLVIVEEVECPKFKKGDWVLMSDNGNSPWLIFEVTPNYYNMEDLHENITARRHSIVDNGYHLWTLNDAKPGDVLVAEDSKCPFIFKGCVDKDHPKYPVAYCGINKINEFIISSGQYWWTNDKTRPATSEEMEVLFNNMKNAGYKWDAESLTLTKIQKRWRDDEDASVNGYFIDIDSHIESCSGWNNSINYNLFTTEKQAKSALAMARISQIMANDERFGGVVTDDEWDERPWYNILRVKKALIIVRPRTTYEFLAFHTLEQAELFLKENEDLIKDYYMMD